MDGADSLIAVGIDHLILAVHDLEAASQTFAAQLGFHVGGGGTHPRFGTANRLIVLDNAYIELIAAQPDAVPHGFIGAILERGVEGWVSFALATPDPGAAAAAMRTQGVTVDGPEPGQLATTTGHDRAWQTVRMRDGGARGLPFLIRHEQHGQEHRRLLAGSEGLHPHPIGARAVAAITLAVHDLAAAAREYRDLFGLIAGDGGEEDPMLQATVQSLRLASGVPVRLAAPLQSGVGPVAMALERQGEGLFAVTLAVDDLQSAVSILRGRGVGVRVDEPDGILTAAQLNLAQTHGARIGLVSGVPTRAN